MRALSVTPDQLIEFAQTLYGRKLETRSRKKAFTVGVKEPSGNQLKRMLVFTPLSSRKPRRQQWQHILSVIEKFNAASENDRLKAKTYGNNSINASYQLALMVAYFDHLGHLTHG